MNAEQILAEISFRFLTLFLTRVNNLHWVFTTRFKNLNPKGKFILQSVSRILVCTIVQENILDGFSTRIHILNTFDKSLQQLEASKFIQSRQAFLKEFRRICYSLSFL